jgi:acyl-CoA thioesterase-1
MPVLPLRAAAVPILIAALAAACADRPASDAPETAAVPVAPHTPVSRASTAAMDRPRIVFLGDSLTAGHGLTPADAFPALIERRLRDAGHAYEIVNAGVSGDTSAGGLRRLEWSLEGDVQVLVVALGGNDGLRGLPPAQLRENLARIIETAQARGIDVILAGMEAPPNFGATYTQQFRDVYRDLAEQYSVPLIPFFLEGVAGVPSLNQSDGIHPNREGQRRIADTIWQALRPVIDSHATS